MAKNALDDYSTTAASNTDIDGLDSTGATGLVKSGDNYTRSMMAHAKAKMLDLGASNTVAGTGDAITVTLASNTTALYDGMRISVNAPGTNTGAATIAVTNSGATLLGTKKIRKWSGGSETALSAGDITQNHILNLVYDSARDTASGAFMIDGSASVAAATTSAAGIVELLTTTELLTGTDTTRAATADAIAALWEKGSDEASAATVAFGEGGFFHVTGTTTITDIDWDTAKDGRMAWVVFDGALTLTHNATTLQLPGGANITTAAGDRALFVQDSSDNVICLSYVRAAASATNGMEYVTSIAASSSSTINFDTSTGVTFDANYDYIIKVTNAKPSADCNILVRYGTGGTPTYQNTGYTHQNGLFQTTTVSGTRDSITTGIMISHTNFGGASAGETFSCEMTVEDVTANDTHWLRNFYTGMGTDGLILEGITSGRRSTSEVLTGIQVLPSTGNFTTGTFTLYRRKIR